MLFEDVDPHHSLVELWIQRLDDFIVEMLLQMFKKKKKKDMKWCVLTTRTYRLWHRLDSWAVYLILQSIEAFKDEFKHGVEVVWAR